MIVCKTVVHGRRELGANVASGREAVRRGAREAQACKARVLVLCAYLRPGRDKGRSRYVMQPISGLHVASLLDPDTFEVRLYHEDWHGSFETSNCGCYDLVFLTGLQPDFDRMRQLAYFFKRSGAVVVAGGSVCTSFPEFAAQFFDVVCAGGVESARDVAADFLRGDLKTIYRSDIRRIAPYAVDYSHFARSGVNPIVHLVETSRGCSFKCNFCSIPAEVHGYAAYDLTAVSAAIDSSLASAPLFSFRRWYPIVMLLDNNFSDNRDHMLKVCDLLKSHNKVRGWGALVTQNVLHDRELIRRLSQSKCNGLFIGLESLDRELLRRQNKTQNLSRQDIIEDIAFVESLGVGVTYGYLFDPRHQSAADMRSQVQAIARHPLMPMPTYFSVIAPIAGTKAFWDDLASGGLAANLRLRDLEGETIAYSRLADDKPALVDFLELHAPAAVADRRAVRHREEDPQADPPVRDVEPGPLVLHRRRQLPFLPGGGRRKNRRPHLSRRRRARSTIFRAPGRFVGRGPGALLRADRGDRRPRRAGRLAQAVLCGMESDGVSRQGSEARAAPLI